jgi:hypothetical protein
MKTFLISGSARLAIYTRLRKLSLDNWDDIENCGVCQGVIKLRDGSKEGDPDERKEYGVYVLDGLAKVKEGLIIGSMAVPWKEERVPASKDGVKELQLEDGRAKWLEEWLSKPQVLQSFMRKDHSGLRLLSDALKAKEPIDQSEAWRKTLNERIEIEKEDE